MWTYSDEMENSIHQLMGVANILETYQETSHTMMIDEDAMEIIISKVREVIGTLETVQENM